MKLIPLYVDLFHLFVRYFYPCFIFLFIKHSMYSESLLCCGIANKLKNDFIRNKRLCSPIESNKGKELMFNSIPFTCTWRIVTHMYCQSCLICESLEHYFPQSVSD